MSSELSRTWLGHVQRRPKTRMLTKFAHASGWNPYLPCTVERPCRFAVVHALAGAGLRSNLDRNVRGADEHKPTPMVLGAG